MSGEKLKLCRKRNPLEMLEWKSAITEINSLMSSREDSRWGKRVSKLADRLKKMISATEREIIEEIKMNPQGWNGMV